MPFRKYNKIMENAQKQGGDPMEHMERIKKIRQARGETLQDMATLLETTQPQYFKE